MQSFSSIRNWFHPIQPAVQLDHSEISYQEHLPPPPLADYIYCYWQLKTKYPLEAPYFYRVVSDACIDIFFNHNRREESFVMGFCKKYTAFPLGQDFDFIGIRFFPTAFPHLFNISAKSVINQEYPLVAFLPEMANFLLGLEKKSFPEIRSAFNAYLSPIIQKQHQIMDARFYEALLLILKNHGHIETEKDLNTGLSPRQLRRIFNYYIGTTPKSFSQVIRFQYILNAQNTQADALQNKIYYDVGFYDQAHFIKEFTRFYGVTPHKAFH